MIYVCGHKDFVIPEVVKNPDMYIPINRTNLDDTCIKFGRDDFSIYNKGEAYKELHMIAYLLEHRELLPNTVGICSYRKYFDIDHEEKPLCIYPIGVNVYEHYKNIHNIEDLDIITKIIDERYPTISNEWQEYIHGDNLYYAYM